MGETKGQAACLEANVESLPAIWLHGALVYDGDGATGM
jgi:hypothetical protein